MSSEQPSVSSRIAKSFFLAAFSVGVFLLLAVPVLPGQSLFIGPADYEAGVDPNSIVVADFNGDGLPDLATANSYVNTVTVNLQNPDGSFQLPVSYAVGNGPASLQVGDVNNDGKPDLLVVNLTDNTLSVLLGNGDGTFQAQIVTKIIGPITGATCCLAVADFDGDGKLDVASPVPPPTMPGSYGVAILLGNGDGTFQSPVTYPTNGQANAIVAADFTNNGKVDIAAGNSLLLGNGDGTFQAPISLPLPSGPLVVADFNQDGNLDIATSGLTILYGNGDGTFQAQPLSVTGAPLAAGDLNGDGKPDLIAQVNPNGAYADIESLLNEGTSTFAIAQTLQDTFPGTLAVLKSGQPLSLLTFAPSGGELSTEIPGIVTVLNGNGDGTFALFPSYPAFPASQPTGSGTMAVADFNGDGKPDLVIAEILYGESDALPTCQLGLLLNNGEGFATATQIPLPSGGSYPVAADFNGDGKMDLAVGGEVDIEGCQSGGGVLLGNGDGTFQPEVGYNFGSSLAAGDFNNDGKLDLVWVDIVGNLDVSLGNGDGTFGLPFVSPVGPGFHATAIAVGDFNRDGKLDVAAVISNSENSQQPQIQIMTGNGDGTFSIGAAYTLNAPSSDPPVTIATGDLNGDGIPDLVVGIPGYGYGVASPGLDSIAVLLGNGDGTFQSPITTVAGNGISSIMVADFNLDGKQDVAFSNTDWSDVSVLLGKGDGTFQAPLRFSPLTFFTGISIPIAVADFDGNGSPDIALAELPSENFLNGIFLLLNVSNGGSAALVAPAALAFGSQTVNQASAAQSVILKNTNSTALSISSIAISGAQSGDYQQSNTCGTSLGAGAACAISVIFTPQAAGARTAVIQITDNALNSPQTISLTGAGTAAPDFTVGTASGGSSSATISAGQTATFSLAFIPVGSFSGTVTLMCSITPKVSPAPICSVPASVNVSGTSASMATVTITTTASGSVGGSPARSWPTGMGVLEWAFALGALGLLFVGTRRRVRLPGIVMVLVFGAMTGCGSGSSSSPSTMTGSQGTSAGTPTGTYTATVTATSGSLSHQAALTVIVQ